MLKKIRYTCEAIFLVLGVLMFRLLPLDIASALGGKLARMFGPLTRGHRVAEENLKHAMPEMNAASRARCLNGMWDNLGRVIGEYPHLSRPIMHRRITIEGREHLERIKRNANGSIFVSGHFANWEIVPLAAHIYNVPAALIYRPPNNPAADWIVRRLRSAFTDSMHPKGRDGAAQSIKAIKAGKAVGMLIDQKMNDGSPISFFDQPAMTATAATQLAIKFQVPLLATRVVRTDGAHFHLTIMPPMLYDPHQSPERAMQDIHRLFEQWIREKPEQWFWVHKRWNWDQKSQ